jgi:hypothetical protein
MSQSSEIKMAVNKLLEFTEFFLSLGDMKQTDMLIAIAKRDPEFTSFFETANDPIETAMDFFKVYSSWAIEQIRKTYDYAWNDIRQAYISSKKYQILKMQCDQTIVLWDVLDNIINNEKIL